MQIGGTLATGIPFCLRASRKRAEGRKTDVESVCLLSSSGGVPMSMSCLSRIEEKR